MHQAAVSSARGGDEAHAALRASARRIHSAADELIDAANGQQEKGAAT